MLTAGVIAIVVFKEVKGIQRISLFIASGVLLIIGGALLANFGRCAVY